MQAQIPRDYNAADDLVGRNLKAGRAGKLAYVDDAGQCTFGELAERVNRFGNHLLSLGLRMEDRILIAMHDTVDWPVAFLGAIKAGIVPIAVNTLLTPKDYEYMLSDSRAKALLVSAPGDVPTDVSGSAVERFLQGTTSEQREAALAASVPRFFNQDVLSTILDVDAARVALG